MKRLLMILCVLMLCLAAATAEERLDDAHRYALVGPVYEGFTWAVAVDGVTEDPYEEGVWYIIDVHGNRLTDEALLVRNQYFSQGLVTVYKDGKAGCIDTEGRVAIPFEFYEIKSFSSAGYAIAALGETWGTAFWGVIDRQGQWVIPCEWDDIRIESPAKESEQLALVWRDGKAGILNMAGETMLPCEYFFGWFDSFCEGRLQVQRKNAGYGYVNELGQLCIPCQWTYASVFSEGLARVLNGDKSSFIDSDGHIVFDLPDGWHARDDFHEGYALATNDQGLYGYIDPTGALAISCQWDKAEAFSEGAAKVCLNGKYGFIDQTGAYISPCQWAQASSYRNGYAIVQDENSLMGIIDREGRLTVPCAYAYLQFLGNQGNPGIPIYIMKDCIQGVTLYGLIRADGTIVSPCQWSLISGIETDGIAEVYLDFVSASAYDEWNGQESTSGFMDLNGDLIVPCEYDNGYYRGGYFTLIKDGYLTILDRDANLIF